ncbi:NUDIX hydrolase [Legionella fairfieldensis]|uniref:NUDIX hydrolase n=1 Tax=Legionella fairfieldensis TaxID=45064 RepID=UPI000491FB2A|nr:CoA pyrophosphatase [Legionella fairfieldensis]
MDFSERGKNPEQQAAVIVLYERASDSLILTQRSANLRNHPSEICFPGGKWEQGDANLYETALRELQEELGISSQRVQLIRPMTPERTLTGYIIHPWLSSIETIAPYSIDNNEVSDIFSLSMNDVSKASNYQEIMVSRFGFSIKSYQYTATPHFVWGATARIMMQLIR